MNKAFLTEDDAIMTGENPAEYRQRLLTRIQSGDISGMDNHDRVHGAFAFIDSIRDHYQGRDRNIVLNVNGVGTDGGAKIGFIVHGVQSKGKHLMVQPAAKGAASHPRLEELPVKNIYGLQMSAYPNMKAEHREVLRRLMDFRGLRETKEQLTQKYYNILHESLIDTAQTALDVVDLADPTPITSGINTAISLGRYFTSDDEAERKEQLTNASLRALGILPVFGDFAKAGIYGSKVAKVATNPTLNKIARNPIVTNLLKTASDIPKARTASKSSLSPEELDMIRQGLESNLSK